MFFLRFFITDGFRFNDPIWFFCKSLFGWPRFVFRIWNIYFLIVFFVWVLLFLLFLSWSLSGLLFVCSWNFICTIFCGFSWTCILLVNLIPSSFKLLYITHPHFFERYILLLSSNCSKPWLILLELFDFFCCKTPNWHI